MIQIPNNLSHTGPVKTLFEAKIPGYQDEYACVILKLVSDPTQRYPGWEEDHPGWEEECPKSVEESVALATVIPALKEQQYLCDGQKPPIRVSLPKISPKLRRTLTNRLVRFLRGRFPRFYSAYELGLMVNFYDRQINLHDDPDIPPEFDSGHWKYAGYELHENQIAVLLKTSPRVERVENVFYRYKPTQKGGTR
jgi:hypothetical protein